MSPQPQGRAVLIGGGARSGKSRFALERALAMGKRPALIATARPIDAEMAARIARHRHERGSGWRTVEAPLDLLPALDACAEHDVVVVDCLTVWLSNVLVENGSSRAAESEIDRLLAQLRPRPFHVLLVSNEVGMGIVPETPLGRIFRDLSGGLHQRLAPLCDEVFLAAMGMVLQLKPGPVSAIQIAKEHAT